MSQCKKNIWNSKSKSKSQNLSKRKLRWFEIKLCGKRLYPIESVKYLCVKIDTNISWQYHVNDFPIKLNKVNDLILKIRKSGFYLTVYKMQFAIGFNNFAVIFW